MVNEFDLRFAQSEVAHSIEVKQSLLSSSQLLTDVLVLGDHCAKCLEKGGKVIFAGNGGSFADAQHLAAEFVSKLNTDRRPLSAIALGTNNSNVSAIGNDYGFDYIFSRELRVLSSTNDLFIPISTSGNSANILEAVRTALEMNIKIIGLTGKSGGQLAKLAPSIVVPSDNVARIQECHILMGHIICGIAERSFIA